MENTGAVPAKTTEGMAKAVYILYLVGIFTGLTALVGVVIAYVNRSDAPEWLRTHYQFQIRTFWMSCLWAVATVILSFVLIGILVGLVWLVWLVVRCIKGWKALTTQQAVANPTTWWF